MKQLIDWFRDQGIVNLLTFMISVVAVFVSLLAISASRKVNRKANEIRTRLLAIEEQREANRMAHSRGAALQPEIRPTNRRDYRLYICNRGQAEARNVKILMDGKPLLDHPVVPKGETLPDLIGPGAEISCCLAISFESPPPFEINITWEDNSGEQGFYRTKLTL